MSGSKKNEEALMVPPCDAKSSQKEYFQLVENWQRKLLEICVNKTLIHYNPTYFKYNPVNPESLEFHSTKFNK